MKKYFLVIVPFLLGLIFAADPYTKRIGLYDLVITAPESEQEDDIIRFYSEPDQQDVEILYNQTAIRAGAVLLDESTDRIYLTGGFRSRYLRNEISGTNLEYHLAAEELDGQDITISTDDFFSRSERLSFYGRKITMYQPTLGVEVLHFSMKSRQFDLYPGWGVFYDTTFRWRDVPFWYIPVYVVDKRRNAFGLPGSFPEFGYDYFSGEYVKFNNHYYINESLYGNLYFGYAELKGYGLGMQNIVRLSDYDHLTYINENWQYARTTEVLSYEHSFLNMPNADNRKMTFNELLRYNEEIKGIATNSLRISRTVNEEDGMDILNRDIEVAYIARFNALEDWFSVYTANTYTSLRELTTDTAGSSIKSYTELSHEVEIPYLATVRPGIGYDTVKYSIHPHSWHRVFSFLTTGKRLWIFNWRVRIYDYIDERGNSPFSYDTPNAIGDNVLTTTAVSLWDITLGRTERYIIYDGRIHRRIYFVEYTSRPWILRLEHNQTENSWWGGISASF